MNKNTFIFLILTKYSCNNKAVSYTMKRLYSPELVDLNFLKTRE